MQAFREFLAEHDLSPETLMITAYYALEFSHTKTTPLSGILGDYYEPEIVQVCVSNLESDSEMVVPDGLALNEIAVGIKNTHKSPIYAEVVPHGQNPSQEGRTGLRVPCAATMLMIEAAAELDAAIFSGSDEEYEAARWKVFQLTDVFQARPCSRGTFDFLSTEKDRLGDSRHFTDFYMHWHKSTSTHLDGSELNAQTVAAVETIIEEMVANDLDALPIKNRVLSQLKVHELHRPLFETLIDERISERSTTPTR